MHYFDTSILVPLLFVESTSASVQRLLERLDVAELATSDWTRVEFSSVMAREVRMGGLSSHNATRIDDAFRAKVSDAFQVFLPVREDFDLAREYARDHKTGLRAPDALHLAVAANHHAEKIYTLDKGMLKAGKRLGLPVSAGIRLAGSRA